MITNHLLADISRTVGGQNLFDFFSTYILRDKGNALPLTAIGRFYDRFSRSRVLYALSQMLNGLLSRQEVTISIKEVTALIIYIYIYGVLTPWKKRGVKFFCLTTEKD